MNRVRTLVVDDSAFARKVVREVLSADAGIEVVGTARDGIDALEKIAELRPDVVTLDLVMPNLDGLGVMRALESARWKPAIVIVSAAGEDSELGLAALSLGAFDVVKKPTALANEHLYTMGNDVCSTVLAAARRASAPPRVRPPPAEGTATVREAVRATRTKILLIGASTGGPQALTQLIRALPATFPVPVAIVLHMPAGYTETFARRLDSDCALDVLEARDGLPLRTGLVIVARAGIHLTLASEDKDSAWNCKLELSPMTSLHRPSVDVLFASGAAEVGAGVLSVVLTGMGTDGLEGSRAIAAAGGRILTEAESSCVVYGMPRAVFEAGLATAEAPIDRMAALICDHL